jgi:hypothetical protein
MSARGTESGPRRTGWRLLVHYGKRALLLEVWGYVSIFRYVFRRPKVPPGATAFTYHRPMKPMLIAFIVVSAVELLAVDLVVRRWPTVRMAFLVLGVWGLVWMLGLLFGFLTRPHAVGPAGIRVRAGAEVDIGLEWDVIDSVGRNKRVARDKQPLVTAEKDGTCALHQPIQQETNIEISLRRPVTVRLPHGTETVSTIHLFADLPEQFTDEVRRHCARVLGPVG